MDAGLKKERKPNPRENAFPLSAVTFWYTLPTFLRGFRRDLDERDLPTTLREHASARLGDRMERAWRREEERVAKQGKGRNPSLMRAIFRVFGLEFAFLGLVLALSEAIRVAQPLALGVLLKYYVPDQQEVTREEAYWYAGGVVACSLINVLLSHPYMMAVVHLGMKVRVACCSLVYRKALRLSKTALGHTTAGQVVNLLSNDVSRFDVAVIFAHQLWVAPLETVVCAVLMYQVVGWSAVIGVAALVVFVPVQIFLGRQVSIYRLKTALRTDERVRLMNEIISGIQVIKMYAWEKPFAHLVALSRRFEIKSIRIASFMRGLTLCFILFTTRLSIFASILAYVLLGNAITAEKVFVITSFYNILRQTMAVFFPQGITQVAEANVSIRRLNQFMLYDETQMAQEVRQLLREAPPEDRKKKLHPGDLTHMRASKQNGEAVKREQGVRMDHVTAKWTESSSDDTLSEVTLRAVPGQLLAVIGPVGSGKSSLLHVILKELLLKSGTMHVEGEISYASQEPWLFAGTVRQNILFGLPMDRLRYKNVVRRCALQRDLELLPYGDKTVVGDRGVSLSGGQRARINLARAVYKQADVYLLDDPLSAVDTHVGKELFEQCVQGYLRDKTVILVTHQLQYLKTVDNIVYLDNGVVKAQGTYKELMELGLDFTRLLGDHPKEDGDGEESEEEQELQRQGSIRSIRSLEVGELPVVVEEQRGTGSVGGDVYGAYFRAGGNCCRIFMLFALFGISQLWASASDYFLTYWVNIEQEDHPEEAESVARGELLGSNWTPLANNFTSPPTLNFTLPTINELISPSMQALTSPMLAAATNTTDDNFWHFSRETSIYVYSVIIGLLIFTTVVRTIYFFSFCMRASITLHNNMFESITRATMRFFNTNSAGRILNRFSKDMGAVDELLTAAMTDCLQIGLVLLGIIIIVAVVNYWLLIPTIIIGIIFYLLRKFYLRTSRSIKRLEGITRSPVFSHLNASIQGLTTIRAFCAQEILEKEFDNHQDLHSAAWFDFLATSRAFGYWLDLVCIVYITVVTFSFLLLKDEQFGGNVGLAITQAIGMTGTLQWGMRQSTELENQMTSVERIVDYDKIEHEKELESMVHKKPPKFWPEFGKIEFRNIFLRYFPEDPPVLRDLSFTIAPKEKVGIVGRTGAGKSSLINALFQLTDTEGSLLVDDIDITKLGLHDLRKKISIIPQEPVLFSGTMRKNLDPFEEYGDAEIWQALEDVKLKEAVNDLVSGLSSKVSEGGSNFSVGQRQLVCLARAILRNNRILVLDEATANVDPQTDILIQATIREKFANCTVLTIAHRLHTVMDSDKVLVMDAGTMKEFDHPWTLLQDADGYLFSMVEQTGPAMTEALRNVAKESYEKIQERVQK